MIIYNPHIKSSLQEFGIEIPISNSKADKTFQKLSMHPELQKSKHQWNTVFNNNERITKADLLRVHSEMYIHELYSDQLEKWIIQTYELIDENGHYHRYDPDKATLPLKDLRDWILTKVSGTYQCCRTALKEKFCFYFGGGMHHAHYDYGSGFCLINDLVVSLKKLQFEKKIKNAWVIDVDAHKGDGTADLTKEDKTIVTLSIHMASGWPLDGQKYNQNQELNPAFIPNNIDIPIESSEEKFYLERLEQGLKQLEKMSSPDLALVVLGSDPYEKDQLESTQKMKLSFEQMIQRDQLIYHFLTDNKIPAAFVMAGGYGENSWEIYYEFLSWVLLHNFN